MSLPERIARAVTTHTRVVLVALLLSTALIGSGVTMIDDDSSLDQFESDSPEAEAQEYISDNFGGNQTDNTSTVQLLTVDDDGDALSQESLLASLEFQQEIRANDSINATLAENNSITGVENLLVIQTMLDERIDELEAESDDLNESADQLEEDFDELNETADQLEEDFDALNESVDSLEDDADSLAEDQAELEERVGYLESGLNETAELQAEIEQAAFFGDPTQPLEDEIDDTLENASIQAELNATQNATYLDASDQLRTNVSAEAGLEVRIEAGPGTATGIQDPEAPENQILRGSLNETIGLQTEYDAAENESEREAINQSIEQSWETAQSDANLDQTQNATFQTIGDEVRELTTERNEAPPVEAAFEQGTFGVFQAEFQELEEDASDLADRGDRLEERGDELADRADELEDRADELEDRADELEERGDELEDAFDELEDFDPSLSEQITYLESMNQSAFETAIDDTLGDDDNDFILELMPSSYEPGDRTADMRLTTIIQDGDSGGMEGGGGGDSETLDAQLDLRTLADQQDADYRVFGAGILNEEIDQSMGDSLAIVGPLAMLFVLLTLAIAYRDLVDILLGFVGIIAVLVWTFGFMGWAGIPFNQMLVAVPVLLIGLSIDYAIHVFMRHREQRGADNGAETVRDSMSITLAGVGVALMWVTATTMFGFLSNLISPIGPIGEFGIVSAFGVGAAMVIFGMLIPAAKIEIDEFAEARGIDRRKRAFGTGGGPFTKVLSIGSTAARKAPLVVLVAALLLTAGGVYGASQVDTSFDEEDFLAESPPAWTENLGPFSPGEYRASDDLQLINDNFQRDGFDAEILVRGDPTADNTLEEVKAAEERGNGSDVIFQRAGGGADVDSPLTVMDDVASDNSSFNETFTDADTTGDGVPDEDIEAVYDHLFEVEPDEADDVIYRTDDGEYEAIRMVFAIQGNAGSGETTDEMRSIAAAFEEGGGSQWTAIATGDPIVSHLVEQDLLNTVLQSLVITLIAVFVFLTLAYWLAGSGAVLGLVTLTPVAVAVSWILGTMYLIDVPFNVLTGTITSLTIGLGVAYSIHVSSRYTLELKRQGNVWEAMETTVTGTGGALLGSAATTVGGFGTLALAILPVLQQFGIVTGLTIIYTFAASVFFLPTLLVLWTRYFGPDVSFETETPAVDQPAASDRQTPAVESSEDDD